MRWHGHPFVRTRHPGARLIAFLIALVMLAAMLAAAPIVTVAVTPRARAGGVSTVTPMCAGATDRAGNLALPVSVTDRVRLR